MFWEASCSLGANRKRGWLDILCEIRCEETLMMMLTFCESEMVPHVRGVSVVLRGVLGLDEKSRNHNAEAFCWPLGIGGWQWLWREVVSPQLSV